MLFVYIVVMTYVTASNQISSGEYTGSIFQVRVRLAPERLRRLQRIAGETHVRTLTVNNVNYDDFSLLCAEGIPLLMEDHKPRPCQPRPWKAEQRCPAGFWCHEGEEESSFYCCPRSRKVSNLCHLPPATGFGKETMRRFYYDWKTDGCHELHYTGIGGNENSFITYEACENACRGVGEPQSKAFGGLSGGNSTNSTKEPEVKKNPEKEKPIKNLPPTISFTISSTVEPVRVVPKEPKMKTRKTTTSRPTTSTTQTTTSFVLPTTTTTTTTTVPQTVPTTPFATTPFTDDPFTVENPCVLPPERGFSGGVVRKMWYFDMSTLSCVQFTYQGSGGNFNKFDTPEVCMSVCGIGKPTKKSCENPPALGNGPFKIPRYYFDNTTQKCELFFYSGEDGNDNRFFKRHKCERLCLGKSSKKKETTKGIEAITSPPTRVIVNFVSSEATSPSTVAQLPTRVPFTETDLWTVEPTRYTATPKPVFPTFDRLETRKPVHVIEQLPETTTAATRKTQSTHPATLVSEVPIAPTAGEVPTEPSTFPTLVYVPREEVPETTARPYLPLDELFSQLMTVEVPRTLLETTGAPTIIEKSQIGPAPDTNIPLGNFPWETTPPGFVFPSEIDPSLSVIYVQSPEQLEAMVKAMAVTPPAHHLHGGPLPVNTPPTVIPEERQPVPPLTSLPIYQRQWGVQPPQTPFGVVQPQQPNQIQQSSQQQPFPSLPAVVPVSSGNNVGVSKTIEIPPQPFAIPATTPLPTTEGNQQPPQVFIPSVQPVPPLPPTNNSGPQITPLENVPRGSIINGILSVSTVEVPPVPTVVINEVPTEMFTVNVSEVQPIDVQVNVVTDSSLLLPNISMSFVGPSPNSPCQLPVTDPDVIIMCELTDVVCPTGSFCQIGLAQSICCPSMGIPACMQPMERGVGSSQLTRWFFNPQTNQCETFSFAGFQGNENNFVSFSDCQRTCNARNPCENGEPVAAIDPENSCSSMNRCPPEAMCHSTGSSVACCAPRVSPKTTPKPAINNDPCHQPTAEGYGAESQHRWAFDRSAGRCVSFIFQGKGGNLNNFLTKSDCQSICGAPLTVPSRCLQPGVSGDGDSFLARYFYSPEYRQCLHFIYSGSGGNENNFQTQQDCLETCVANGIKFSSLASNVAPFTFSFIPSPVCPQGKPLMDATGGVLSCSRTGTCPNGHVCTSMGSSRFCCPAPESFCLESRPPVSVCSGNGSPVPEIRFTYDPLTDKCARFSYNDCHSSVVNSLNSFLSKPQCSRLCCNQGFNLIYRRKMRLVMNDSPIHEEVKRT